MKPISFSISVGRKTIMKGNSSASKLFALLSSKSSLRKKQTNRPGSIACLRDVSPSTPFYVHPSLKNGSAEDVHHSSRNISTTRGKTADWSISVSGNISGHESTRCCDHNTLPEKDPNRKRTVNKNIEECFKIEKIDFKDIQEIYRLLEIADKSINNETRIQGGLLTTTLCSTELWLRKELKSKLSGSDRIASFRNDMEQKYFWYIEHGFSFYSEKHGYKTYHKNWIPWSIILWESKLALTIKIWRYARWFHLYIFSLL